MTARTRKGFTLMELLMVIVVIGVLAGLLLPVLLSSKEKAKRMRARAEAGQLELALRSYYSDNRGWASLNVSDSGSTLVNALNGSGGKVPYMEFSTRNLSGGALVDPWGNTYKIRLCNDQNEVVTRDGTLSRICAVWSLGTNGKQDSSSSEDDDDVLSWK